jgi:hypothetical protein
MNFFDFNIYEGEEKENIDPDFKGSNKAEQKVEWTRFEKGLLTKSVKKHGEANWEAIAKDVKTKSSLQCRKSRKFSFLRRSMVGSQK